MDAGFREELNPESEFLRTGRKGDPSPLCRMSCVAYRPRSSQTATQDKILRQLGCNNL